jgi:hypothetical protein
MSENLALDALLEFFNALEAGIVSAKQMITQAKQPSSAAVVGETTFTILSFEKQTSSKIGEYEVAYKKANFPDKWTHAYNILRQNNATISKRYHSEGYVHSYWLYGNDRIYRQKLKTQ